MENYTLLWAAGPSALPSRAGGGRWFAFEGSTARLSRRLQTALRALLGAVPVRQPGALRPSGNATSGLVWERVESRLFLLLLYIEQSL